MEEGLFRRGVSCDAIATKPSSDPRGALALGGPSASGRFPPQNPCGSVLGMSCPWGVGVTLGEGFLLPDPRRPS